MKKGIRVREVSVKDVFQGMVHPVKVGVGKNADPYLICHAPTPQAAGNVSAQNIRLKGLCSRFFRVYQAGKKTQAIITSFMKTFDR
jgi:hypothetical protein